MGQCKKCGIQTGFLIDWCDSCLDGENPQYADLRRKDRSPWPTVLKVLLAAIPVIWITLRLTVPDDQARHLQLGNWEIIRQRRAPHAVSGVVINKADYPMSYVEVQFNLYDEAGSLVGNTTAGISNLDARGIWRLEAPFDGGFNVSRAKVKSVTAKR